jgi:hypothetical protein
LVHVTEACPGSFLAWEERWLQTGDRVVNGDRGTTKGQ